MTKETKINKLIEETKGKFFSITFRKKDGTVRVINGKDRYLRLIRGGESKVAEAGYRSAVNRNKDNWFAFKPENVVRFTCGAINETL